MVENIKMLFQSVLQRHILDELFLMRNCQGHLEVKTPHHSWVDYGGGHHAGMGI